MNSWSQRSLTIKGRITVSKALLISLIVYVASSINIPNVDLQTIQSLIMKFLWRGRPPKVAFKTLCQDIKQGGLMAPDVVKCYTALRQQWAKRIYVNVDSQWRQILQARTKGYELKDLLKNRNANSFIRKLNIPEFYKDVLNKFQTIFTHDMNDASQVRQESLWNNDAIRVGGKTIFIKNLYDTGIKTVNDLTDPNNSFLSYLQFKERHPLVRINFLRYQSILSAIPIAWKNIIRQNPTALLSLQDQRCCFVSLNNDARVCLRFLRSKHVYRKLIRSEIRTPTAQRKWLDEGHNIQSWGKIYEIPFKSCSSTRLQSLQFRVLHRYIPTRKFLCSRNIVGSRLCLTCFEIDTIQHFFYSCSDVEAIWETILSKLQNIFRLPGDFSTLNTVIFGYVRGPPVVNLILLLCKQYIVSSKLGSSPRTPNVEGAMQCIINQYETEKLIAITARKTELFSTKWEGVVDRNGNNMLV